MVVIWGMVRAAGFEPAISAFQARRGRPDSPTPCLGRGSTNLWLAVRILFNYSLPNDLSSLLEWDASSLLMHADIDLHVCTQAKEARDAVSRVYELHYPVLSSQTLEANFTDDRPSGIRLSHGVSLSLA